MIAAYLTLGHWTGDYGFKCLAKKDAFRLGKTTMAKDNTMAKDKTTDGALGFHCFEAAS